MLLLEDRDRGAERAVLVPPEVRARRDRPADPRIEACRWCLQCRPVEPETNVIGAHIVQSVKNRKGLPPHGPGHLLVPGGAEGIAETGQDGRLLRPVAHLPEKTQRTPVARHRLAAAAELLPGIAQMIPRVGLLEGITDFAVQIDSLATACHGPWHEGLVRQAPFRE
jgi:hypothetical protein